ncbi:MAG: GntR family transcriptional regulator [Alphaproteobacteria bacterium]|nr:GntR family transcriptional regulator [Alphaproteobacteria bacterium]
MNDQSIAPVYSRSPMPRYLQVAAAIRRRIEDGHWKANDKIATLVELEKEFQVARVTVRQAIELLQKQGFVKRIQGKGTFVDGRVADKRWLKLDMRWKNLVATIGSNVPRIMKLDTEGPPPVIADEEGRLAEDYVYIESAQSRGRQIYAYARVHVSRQLYKLAPDRFASEPSISVLASMEEVSIGSARQSFIIGYADTKIAHQLKVALGFPTAEARIVVNSEDGETIYVGEIIYRGDCVRIDVDLLD